MQSTSEKMESMIQARRARREASQRESESALQTIPPEGEVIEVQSSESEIETAVVDNDPLVAKKLEIHRAVTTATASKTESATDVLADDSKLRQSIQIMFYRTKINRKRFNDVYSMLRDESKSDEEIISNMLGMSGMKFKKRENCIREFVLKSRRKIHERYGESIDIATEVSSVPSVNATTSAIDFLNMSFDGIDPEFYTNIVAFPSKQLGKGSPKIFWFKISALDALIKQAKIFSEQGYDVSFLAGAIDPETYQALQNDHKRGKDSDIACVRCLHADIDVETFDSDGKPIHGQNEKLAPDLKSALEIIPSALKPTFVINSGHGVHLYWILEEILDLRDPIQRKQFDSMKSNFRAILSANPEHYSIDDKFGASDVLRMPETYNLKTWSGGNKKDLPIVSIIDRSDSVFSISDMEQTLQTLNAKLIPKTENPREISTSQREFVANNGSTKIANSQVSNETVREIIDGSRDLSLIYQNCPVIRAVVNNPQNLSHDIAKLVFPSLLKFKNKPIDGGRELCVELCKQWLGERFNPDLTSRQIDGITELKNSCDSIRALGLPCDYMKCEIYKRGGRCPAAILGNRFSNESGGTIGEVFHDAPEEIQNLLIPTGFDVSESHVEDCRGKYPKIIINAPVVVSKEIIQAGTDNPRYYELKRYRNGRWSSYRVDPVTLMDSKSATSILSRSGINIPSRRAGYATEYFADFIEQNADRIPSIEIYTKLGWIGDRFILPTLNDGGYYIEESETVKKIKRAGDYQISLEIFRESVKYRYIRLLVDANLAAPLLEIVGCRNFILDLICKSHKGKSTAMVLANSLWGIPKLMANFNATENAVEELAADRNSLPTNINEWQMTKSRNRDEIANQIVHRFSEGEGRARLNRDGSQKTTRSWNGILIVTSEESLTSDNTFQGVKTRCWEVFAETIVDDQALCKKIWDTTKRNYGHIGTEFIRRLQDEFRDDTQHEKIRDEFNIFFQKARDAKSQRIIASYAEYVAVIACAHIRFNTWFLGMNEADAMKDTLYFIQREAEALPTETAMLDTERAKDSIIDWIHAYEAHFCRLKPNGYTDDAPIKDPYYGFIDGDGANIIPSELKKALKDRGFNPNKIIREWAQAGDIITSGDKDRFTCKKTDLKSGKRLNVIVLKISTDDQDIDPNSIPF